MKWKIYYDDGTTFSDLDGTPDLAPAFGVQAVVCSPDLWGCGDIVGLIDYLSQPGMHKCVRFGRLTTNKKYADVLDMARSDRDIGSDRHVYERGDYYWWRGD